MRTSLSSRRFRRAFPPGGPPRRPSESLRPVRFGKSRPQLEPGWKMIGDLEGPPLPVRSRPVLGVRGLRCAAALHGLRIGIAFVVAVDGLREVEDPGDARTQPSLRIVKGDLVEILVLPEIAAREQAQGLGHDEVVVFESGAGLVPLLAEDVEVPAWHYVFGFAVRRILELVIAGGELLGDGPDLFDARRLVRLAGAGIDVHGTQRDAPPARAKRTEKWAARRLAEALLGGREHQLHRQVIEFDLPPVVDESHARS